MILLLVLSLLFQQVTEPTPVVARYYCIAGDKPAYGGGWFEAGSVDISGQPFELWCEAIY